VEALLQTSPTDERFLKLQADLIQLITITSGKPPKKAGSGKKEKPWSVGTRCMAPWKDGTYYPARVDKIEERAKKGGNQEVDVTYLQSAETGTVRLKHLQAFTPAIRTELHIGARVWSVASDGLMYQGSIVAFGKGAEEYEVCMDGGGEANHFIAGKDMMSAPEIEQAAADGDAGEIGAWTTTSEIDPASGVGTWKSTKSPKAATKPSGDGKTESNRPTVLHSSWESKKGSGKGQDVNQDAAICMSTLQGVKKAGLFGVADGHGEQGHDISYFVKDRLPTFLAAEQNLKTNPAKSITNALTKLCKQLNEYNKSRKRGSTKTDHLRFNAATSGTTLSFGLRVKDRLWLANIGDSRCIMCQRSAEGKAATGATSVLALKGLRCTQLTVDHKPDEPSEKERVVKTGARVIQLEPGAPFRVCQRLANYPGLAMSRSIGDEWGDDLGVISTPDINEHAITKDDYFALWASDGVFDFMSNDKVVLTAYAHRDNWGEAAKAVAKAARESWIANTGGAYIDDITVVIAVFNQPDED